MVNAITHRRDGFERARPVIDVLKHFRFHRLPEGLRDTGRDFHDLAIKLADQLPENSDLTWGLRQLLTARDCFLRAEPEAAQPVCARRVRRGFAGLLH
jgi:hypothetical protein